MNRLNKLAAAALIGFLGMTRAGADPLDELFRPLGDVKVLANVPAPGFPEGIAVQGNKAYVAGPARFGTAGDGQPSQVFAFDTGSGALLKSYAIQGEDLGRDHANSCLALDLPGRLYVVNLQLGVVRLDPKDGHQEIYAAPLPDLPSCSGVSQGPCSPTVADAPPLPNDIVFDDFGRAYVTDSAQATIWRIPAGGGQPQIWFQDARLDVPFGANGIRLSPDRKKVFFAVTADSAGSGGVLQGGKIYTLPLKNAPAASDLQVFFQYNGELPDGIAFGLSGKLYVALAAPFNSGISILRPDGTEIERLTNTQDPIFPYDSPANIAFNGFGSLLATNHAFATMIPSHFGVLDVFVGDFASPLARPWLP